MVFCERKSQESVVVELPALARAEANQGDVGIDENADIRQGDDVALAYYRKARQTEISEAEQKRVLRKIDLHLMPLLMVSGFLQYLDKQSLNYSVIYELREDLGLVGKQFSWVSSMFYFGYLVWQFPSLLLLQKFPVGKYFSLQVFAWGCFSLLMATTSNFGGLAALRFLLGAAESVQLAAFVIITNMYYKREEHAYRLMLWYAMNGVAIIAGGLFAYGVGHIRSSVALWKFPFLVCGSLSTAWSVVLLFLLPSNPTSAWFLNETERAIAIARVYENKTGVESKTFKRDQAVEALKDPKVWLNAISTGAGNILGGVSAFAGLIIKGFGFSALQTQLLQCPTGLIELISLLVFCSAATFIPNSRLTLSLVATAVALAGSIMLYAVNLNHRWALISGFWLMTGFIPNSFILGLGTVSANIGGHTKKLTAQAVFFICYSVGNIVGPQLYTSAPYRQGLRANVVTLVVVLVTNSLNIVYMIYENRQRRKYLDANKDHLREEDYAFRDYTDKQNPFCFNIL
ncbi:hypothetical protein PV08_06584 [Exophiala spinifera]|uniref:Major facilitator superfamily (MFS) profile domain-containing protein n=1 Tax=Exophiala spinifera TaxID=91928 RepID=A0A0D2BZ16_9EURO|nr:uncharacterized protein PV08_06584 [Exophiala spinifera]KIW16529.1 hypothetical protein PV08_06584 [Exophiala spinifera]